MKEIIRGKVWKFGDNIDTDQIISLQYLLLPDIKEMVPHIFEPLNPEFSTVFKYGDIIVAGKIFGCGFSREQAPLLLKEIGVSAIIAISFARIFFRNSINIGLPIIECEKLQS